MSIAAASGTLAYSTVWFAMGQTSTIGNGSATSSAEVVMMGLSEESPGSSAAGTTGGSSPFNMFGIDVSMTMLGMQESGGSCGTSGSSGGGLLGDLQDLSNTLQSLESALQSGTTGSGSTATGTSTASGSAGDTLMSELSSIVDTLESLDSTLQSSFAGNDSSTTAGAGAGTTAAGTAGGTASAGDQADTHHHRATEMGQLLAMMQSIMTSQQTGSASYGASFSAVQVSA